MKPLLLLLAFSVLSPSFAQEFDKADASSYWAYKALNIPQLTKATPNSIITIAVIDDAFRISHEAIQKYIYKNTKEIAGNMKDDDNNGYIDDVNGWDISDGDPDVRPPQGREAIFYHGTMITSSIISVVENAYGPNTSFKILPIKVLNDQAQSTYLADGYKGMRYAIEQGVNVICCAWSGGSATHEEREIIMDAHKKGIIVIGSAGNLYTERVDPPASLQGVIAVAAVDSSFRKTSSSNFGMRVDISAPGHKVFAASSIGDTYYTYGDGTSAATALVAGCVAALMVAKPNATVQEVTDALLQTTTPINHHHPSYAGKMGSGIPNLNQALAYLTNSKVQSNAFDSLRSKGKILFSHTKQSPTTWHIKPCGVYKNIRVMSVAPSKKDEVALLKIESGDSVHFLGTLKELEQGTVIPGSSAHISFPNPKKKPKHMVLEYFVETIDSSSLYCKDIQYFTESNGTILDGSGSENYANRSACKWQITVPIGKRVRIDFPEFDTEPNVDFVWLFDGTQTNPDYIIAKFSGSNPPPSVISRTNQVLVWFVSSDLNTKSGWKLNYSLYD